MINHKRLLKNKLSYILTLLLLIGSSLLAKADDSSAAYNFLNITSSSRIYALGGVNISTVENDVTTVDQNPALLGPEMDRQIAVGYMRYLGDSNFASARYAGAAGENGAWSAAIRYFGYGKIPGMDENGMPIGDFSPSDISFSGSYSHNLSYYLRGGVELKMLYSSYEQYSAFAIATDLGINYYDEDKNLSLSAVVANLGGQVKRFNQKYDRLPVDVRLGWSQMFGSFPIRFSITAWNLTKWKLPYVDAGDGTNGSETQIKDSFSSNLFRHLVFGADFIPNDRFYVALGYNYKTRTDMSTYSRSFISGFSLGAGVNVNRFSVDLALSQPHTGALTFMLNLRLHFNDFVN